MEDYSDDNRKWIKKLGGAEKVKKDFQNDQHAILHIARLLKQIIIDENEKEFGKTTKISEMPNHTKRNHSTIKRQKDKWRDK
ncbi:MAG: hypothetical protein WCL14_02775 [Bacteroidota bacterium]